MAEKIDNFKKIMRTMLLAQSVSKTTRIITREHNYDDYTVKSNQRHMAHDFAEQILKKFRGHIKEEEIDLGKRLSLELLVIPVDDFKELVEAGIQTLPDELIQRIRNGESIFSST